MAPKTKKALAEKKPEAGKKLPKDAVAVGDKKKKQKAKRVETYNTYISKVLKKVHPDIQISSKAKGIMNNLMNEIFEKLAQESSRVARNNNKATITVKEIRTAVFHVMPDELAKFSALKGYNAVIKFFSYKI